MNTEDLKDTIKRELPNWLREDPAFRAYVMELTRGEFADRRETSDRFYDILGELRRDRERQDQKWAENNRKWDENQAALAAMSAEHNRKWDENQAALAAMSAEHNRKWDENQAALAAMSKERNEPRVGCKPSRTETPARAVHGTGAQTSVEASAHWALAGDCNQSRHSAMP